MTNPPDKCKKGHRRCTQTKCGYYLCGDCKDCETCHARPYEINTSCQRCLACENVPDSLRWDDPTKTEDRQAVTQDEELKKALLKALIVSAAQELQNMEQDKGKEVVIHGK
jgi:hypothetical protein